MGGRLFLNGIVDPRIPGVGKMMTSDAIGQSSWSVGQFTQFFPKDVNGTVFVSQGNLQGWAGSDVGGWINSAWAYLLAAYPTVGGRIFVGPGVYNYTTPIVIGAQFSSVSLEGVGGFGPPSAAASNFGGTILNFTPTSGVALTIGGTNNNGGGVQLSNFALQGAGIGTGATAITIGATAVGSSAGATLKNVTINGWTNGVVWGQVATTGKIAYAVTLINCKIQYCTNGLTPNGEANTMFGGLVANCATGVLGNVNGTDFNAIGTAFDDNTTTALNISQPLFRVTLDACRFENVGGGTESYITQSDGSVVVTGGTMQTDASTGTGTGFVQATGGVFQLTGTWLYSAGRVMTQAFNVSSGSKWFKADPIISPSAPVAAFPALFNTTSAAWPRQGNGNPRANVTPIALASTSAVNVDSRGGFPMPTGVRPATRLRATVHVQAIASGTAQHTLSVRYGTNNSSADAVVFTSLVGSTVTAVAASAQYLIDIILETSTTLWVYAQTMISNVGALGNANQDLGLAAPAAVTTSANNFVGIYLAAGTANALTIRSVAWEVISN